MLLSSPVFPLSVSENDLNNAIQKFVSSRGRSSFQISGKKLVYKPFWFLDFASYSKKGEHFDHSNGTRAMDASTNEFDSIVGEFAKSIPKNATKSPEDYATTEIIRAKSSGNAAKKAAQMALAAEQNIHPENVAITSFELYYLPFWEVSATIGDAQYNFRVNAFSGEITDEGGLTTKEKNIPELVQETISELKTPEGWISNSKTAVNSASGILGSSSKIADLRKVGAIDISIFLLLVVLILVLLRII